MKFIHLSDLHIGKRVNEFSQLEDQEFIFVEILNIIDEQKVEAVVIAGDVYDKSVPTTEAVSLFNRFLTSLSKRDLKVFIISGNHDNAERLSFGNEIMNNSGIFISPSFDGEVLKVKTNDEFGVVNFYLLPFVKPIHIRKYFPDCEVNSYDEAIKVVIQSLNIDENERNVMITHQFITGAIKSESEEISVGGTDNVDYRNFDQFDYVALGHIHGPQSIGRDVVRYCGTPLKYSFSEAKHNKSVAIVTLGEKGNVNIDLIDLIPKRDLVEIKGDYNTLVSKDFYSSLNTDDYYHITLTDEEDVIDAISKLRVIYPNIMKIDYDNCRTRNDTDIVIDENIEEKTPLELFSEFYEMQNNQALSDSQTEYLRNLIEKGE